VEFGEQAKRYPSLTLPISILSGSKDEVLWPSIHAAGIKRDAPHTDLIKLSETGHMPHYAQLDLTQTTIEAHLRAMTGLAEAASAG
jgi:pimeloyl-ACP methyl ester carboxylesterase